MLERRATHFDRDNHSTGNAMLGGDNSADSEGVSTMIGTIVGSLSLAAAGFFYYQHASNSVSISRSAASSNADTSQNPVVIALDKYADLIEQANHDRETIAEERFKCRAEFKQYKLLLEEEVK
ncbi:MAG: hypothetical protein NXI01_03480, partial [Gammaproteobacteria bacterium]|nr:hypothetical protein [Gammaproteobacteria bacterium]